MAKGKTRIHVEAAAPTKDTKERRAREKGVREPTVRPAATPTVQQLQRTLGNQGTLALLRDASSESALAAVVQRHRHRSGHRGAGGIGGPVPPVVVVATMRVQIQCAEPRMDLGQGITEAVPGAGVTTAQIQAAFNVLLQQLPGGIRREARNRLADVMTDIAARVNPATGEVGRNNSTSWPITARGMRGFRLDVENIRGRNLYA